MSAEKHTPGKWQAVKWSHHKTTTVVVDDHTSITGQLVIAECEREEDARLIAAAPKLLAALIALKTANGADNFNGWHEAFLPAIKLANDAIEEATWRPE